MTVTFGKYRLVAEIGQGGMAEVSLALSRGPVGFSKLIVIKRIRPHLADDKEFVKMLVDEARLSARLNHPNIVQTHEVGEQDGRMFMVLEFLEGQPFSRVGRRARKSAGFPLPMHVRVLADVLSGLHHAHELKDYDGTPLQVVHRDISPSNIFITYDGVVKLLDFGIAKSTQRSTQTSTGVVKGKLSYMAPEQALGADTDCRTDIYAIGVILWQACVGRQMWRDMDDIAILGRLIHGDIPVSPKEFNPDVPEGIDAICRKALAPKREDRYATALDLQRALEAWLKSEGTQPTQRDLGDRISELFAEERQSMKAIIEQQLAMIEEDPGTAVTVIGEQLNPESASSQVMVPENAQGRPGGPPSEVLTDAGITAAGQKPSVATKAGKWLPALVGLGLAGAGLVVALERANNDREGGQAAVTPPPVPVPQPVVTASATATSQEPKKLQLVVRASPDTALLSIDAGPWRLTPYEDTVPRDGEVHLVRARADGYENKERHVKFDKDVFVDLELKRKEQRKATPVVRPHHPTPQPPTQPQPPSGLLPWKGGG